MAAPSKRNAAAAYPIGAPQPKVKPSISCGHHVTRLASGYNATSSSDATPSNCARGGSSNRIANPTLSSAAKNHRA